MRIVFENDYIFFALATALGLVLYRYLLPIRYYWSGWLLGVLYVAGTAWLAFGRSGVDRTARTEHALLLGVWLGAALAYVAVRKTQHPLVRLGAEIWKDRDGKVRSVRLIPRGARRRNRFHLIDMLLEIEALNGLRALDLDFTRLYDNDFRHLVEDSKVLESIEHLSMVDARISDEALAGLAKATALRYLNLAGAQHVTGTGLRHLKKLPDLAYVDLVQSGVTHEGVRALRSLRALRTLRVSDDAGLEPSALDKLKDLNPELSIEYESEVLKDDQELIDTAEREAFRRWMRLRLYASRARSERFETELEWLSATAPKEDRTR